MTTLYARWVAVLLLVAVAGGVGYWYYLPLRSTAPRWSIYSEVTNKFSIQYPPDFSVTNDYTYTLLGPGREIHGVAFTVPPSMTAGTNLSSDTKISVEYLNDATCTAASFLDNGQPLPSPTDSVYSFDVKTTTGAAAGNRYEEIVYALSDCKAIRYFIHYGVIENYDPGAVREFDRAQLQNIFDSIRKSFIEDRRG